MVYQKLGRTSSHRRATLRRMVTALFEQESIMTTAAKAKAVQPIAEKMITWGKKGDLHAKRQVFQYLTDESVAKKVLDAVAPRYTNRQGGYTRIMKAAPRRGDAAPMVVLELVEPDVVD